MQKGDLKRSESFVSFLWNYISHFFFINGNSKIDRFWSPNSEGWSELGHDQRQVSCAQYLYLHLGLVPDKTFHTIFEVSSLSAHGYVWWSTIPCSSLCFALLIDENSCVDECVSVYGNGTWSWLTFSLSSLFWLVSHSTFCEIVSSSFFFSFFDPAFPSSHHFKMLLGEEMAQLLLSISSAQKIVISHARTVMMVALMEMVGHLWGRR